MQPQASYVHGAHTVPLIGETIGAYLDSVAQRFGACDALVIPHQGVRWTYDEFNQRATRLAAGLLRLGHRVLLAVSQKSVYLSYIGGPPFDNGKANTWIEQEAKAGNSYGQFHMAMDGLGSGDNQADSAGREWLNKSVAGNNPLALHYLAREHGRLGRHAESVAAYERLTALDSHDLTTQLELFAMRTRIGQAAEAKAGLTAAIAQFKWPRWPAPVGAYYLGTSTLDNLLRQARKESDLAPRRECEVYRHAQAFQAALGQAVSAKALAAKVKQSCAAQAGWSDDEAS